MLIHWLVVALVAVTLPLCTLRATQTVGCQARADLRRREGCHHGPRAVGRHHVDRAFYHPWPKAKR